MRATDYEILYDLPAGEYDDRGAKGVRTVTVRAGRSLEVMCHPIVKLTPEARREARSRRTSPAMAKVNARNLERHMIRLLEANFTKSAFVLTLTYAYPYQPGEYCTTNLNDLWEAYEKRGLPFDVRRVKMDMRNYLAKINRRVKKWAKATGKKAEFKWIIRIEEGTTPPAFGLPPMYHIHAVIEAPGLSLDELEALWTHGSTKMEHFRVNGDWPARMARYLCKQKHGGRWWSHSRNLKIPEPRVSDRAVSRRRMRQIAADVQRNGREILEKLYPGYRVVELPDVRYSDFVAGCYIYARMRRRD